jgi:hypothetical protein
MEQWKFWFCRPFLTVLLPDIYEAIKLGKVVVKHNDIRSCTCCETLKRIALAKCCVSICCLLYSSTLFTGFCWDTFFSSDLATPNLADLLRIHVELQLWERCRPGFTGASSLAAFPQRCSSEPPSLDISFLERQRKPIPGAFKAYTTHLHIMWSLLSEYMCDLSS